MAVKVDEKEREIEELKEEIEELEKVVMGKNYELEKRVREKMDLEETVKVLELSINIKKEKEKKGFNNGEVKGLELQ
ncbi:putative peroxisomal and mitochondrial division factor 1-like [Sesbania bispinosa]|nr:putative peroxisomal and mitochondrial division factor 1-like [Sesbania bispinosa]